MGCDTPGCYICWPPSEDIGYRTYNDSVKFSIPQSYITGVKLITVGQIVDKYDRSELKNLGTGTTMVKSDDASVVFVKSGPDNWVGSSASFTTDGVFNLGNGSSYQSFKMLAVVNTPADPIEKLAAELWAIAHPSNGNKPSGENLLAYKRLAKHVTDKYGPGINGDAEPAFLIDGEGDRWERQEGGKYALRLGGDRCDGKLEDKYAWKTKAQVASSYRGIKKVGYLVKA